jgi:DNA-binding transcriptional LysR family regulator
VNFEHLKNFVAIVDAGTISAAAKKLIIAQPALSAQIKNLEEEYGATLMLRNPRNIELTDAGRILYERIKDISYIEDAARKEIRACVNGSRGTLWLGTTPTIPDPLVYQILLDFHEAYPEISFEIYEQNSDQIIKLLEAGVIEVGIVRSQLFPASTLHSILTTKEYFMAYYHREHPALTPQMDQIPLIQLKALPISISKGLKNRFSSACLEAGFQPNYISTSSSRTLSQLWAADKETVSIVVSPADGDEGEFCYRKILWEHMCTERSFSVARNRKLSAVSYAFLDFCRKHPLVNLWLSNTN